MATGSAAEPDCVHIAIEVPHGPVVETLLERGFTVHAINPKQIVCQTASNNDPTSASNSDEVDDARSRIEMP